MFMYQQIIKVNNRTKLIEFLDCLQSNDFSKETGVQKSTTHGKFSRIQATIVDWTNGKKEKAVVVSYNFHPTVLKAISHAVLTNQLEDFKKTDKYSKKNGYFEQKINFYNKNDEGYSPVSSINIRFQEKMNAPWTITIENGLGIAEISDIGGVSIKRGTYKPLNSATVYLTQLQMIQCMTELKDYIQNFENIHMERMLEYREQYKESCFNSS